MSIDPYSKGYTVTPRALSLAMNRFFSPATRCVYRALYDIVNYKEELKTHYVIDRGQTDISGRKLAEVAGVGYKAVRHALDTLKQWGLIDTEKVGRGAKKTLVTICNYSEFDELQNYRGAVGAQLSPVLGRKFNGENGNDNNDLGEDSEKRGASFDQIGAHNINTVNKHNKDTDWMEILRLKQIELTARGKNAE